MRTVYLGTSEFAATVLSRLAGSGHAPALVLTRPDRASGRGRRQKSPPVADRARELGLQLAQPEDVNSPETFERVAATDPGALCVCAFGAIIRDPLLSAYEAYNVHPSLLPRWRGAAPIERAIQAGDDLTGVCIMRPIEELDAGPVFVRATEPILRDDDYGSLAPRLADLGGELLVRALDERPVPERQPDIGITYADKIERDDRRLDPAWPAVELERTVRALSPHIGAWVSLDGADGEDRLGILRAAARDVDGPAQGAVTESDGSLLLGTPRGALELLEVQPPGKRATAAQAYVRGRVRPDGQNAPRG